MNFDGDVLHGLAHILQMFATIFMLAPSVAEWSKTPEFDAETGGESPVQAPVWAVTFSPYVKWRACQWQGPHNDQRA